jgi:hypothetical protein
MSEETFVQVYEQAMRAKTTDDECTHSVTTTNGGSSDTRGTAQQWPHLLAQRGPVQRDQRGEKCVEHELLVGAQLRARERGHAVKEHLRRLEQS